MKFIPQTSQYSFCISLNLKSKKGHNSVKSLWITSKWPVFYDASPLCNIWIELLHPFKSYWSETIKPKSK